MRRLDITGQRFHFLTALEPADVYVSPAGYRKTMWRARCDCGREIVTTTARLRDGRVKSCGCAWRAMTSKCSIRGCLNERAKWRTVCAAHHSRKARDGGFGVAPIGSKKRKKKIKNRKCGVAGCPNERELAKKHGSRWCSTHRKRRTRLGDPGAEFPIVRGGYRGLAGTFADQRAAKIFTCSTCTGSFKSLTAFEKHRRREHRRSLDDRRS